MINKRTSYISRLIPSDMRQNPRGLLLSLGFFMAALVCPAKSLAVSPNDNIAFATNLTVNFSTISGVYASSFSAVTTGDSTENGEQGGCTTVSRSVWYKFISTAAYTLNAETVGSNYDTVLSVWKGTDAVVSIGGLLATPLACDDDGGGNVTSKVSNVSLIKGVTYFFQVSGFGSASSGGSLVFSSTLTPVLQDLTVPTVKIQQPAEGTYPVYTSIYNISGTAQDQGGLTQVNIILSTGGISAGGSMWNGASWIPACTSSCTLSASLYNGINSTSTVWSYYLPLLLDGMSYFIQAQGVDASGNLSAFTASISSFTYSSPVTANDNMSSAKVIFSSNPLPYVDVTTNTIATNLIQKSPGCEGGSGSRDIWYQYLSTSTDGMTVSSVGNGFNTILAVWKSTGGVLPIPGNSATEIGCDRPYSPNASVSFQLAYGGTYYFQAMSENGNGGAIQLTLQRAGGGDVTAPAAVTDLAASPDYVAGGAQLRWRAPGDDGYTGLAQNYEIRYSTIAPISSTVFGTFNNFSSATLVSNRTPTVAGTQETAYFYGLPQKTTIWFSLLTNDDAFNFSSLSNGATVFVPGTIPIYTSTSPGVAVSVSTVPYSDETNTASSAGVLDKTPTCGTSKISGSDRDMWYVFHALDNRRMTVNTFNSAVDTVLQVWAGSDTAVFQHVACSDDEPGFGLQSKVSFNMIPGTTYFIDPIGMGGGGDVVRLQFDEADSIAPGQLTTLSASPGVSLGEVDLSWTEPADNAYNASSGKVLRYQIRYSSSGSINGSNWTASYTSTGAVRDIEIAPITQFPPTPVSAGSLMTYTIRNLNQGTTYWFSVRSVDGSGNISNASNSPFARAKAPVPLPGDGQGTIQIRDVSDTSVLTQVPASSQTTLNLRYTVGVSSLSAGGRISIKFPDYWSLPCPGCGSGIAGLITLSTITSSVPLSKLSVSYDLNDNTARTIIIKSSNTRLNQGDIINIQYSNAFTQPSRQTGVQFLTQVKGSENGAFLNIPVQPSINVVGGSPVRVSFMDSNYITLGSNQNSPQLLVEPQDVNWVGTTADRTLNMRVFTLRRDTLTYTYHYDNNAQLSKNNFTTFLASATISTAAFQGAGYYYSLSSGVGMATYYQFSIPQGESVQPIYYRTSTLGETLLWVEYNNDFNFGPSTQSFSRNFTIRPNAIGFSGLTALPAVVSPDNDGANDFASIDFNPSDSDMQWRVRIGTDPVLSNLSSLARLNIGGGAASGAPGAAAAAVSASTISVFLDWSGYGRPQGITWYGQDFSGKTLPSGTYIVRLEDTAGTVISTTTLTLSSSFLDIYVDRSGPVSGADVFINGQSGNGYVSRFAKTGSDGKIRVWGLKSGSAYNINANYYDLSTGKSLFGNLSNQSAPSVNTSSITFVEPAILRFHASIPLGSETSYDQWGSINMMELASGFFVTNGSIRIPNNSLESDSGWIYGGFPSSWTTLNVTASGGGSSYKIRLDMFGYTPVDITTTVVGGTQHEFNISLIKKPRIYGMVVLPSTSTLASQGTWVSVEGRKSSQNYPTTWGGVWFPSASGGLTPKSTGYFSLDVDTGTTYILKARGQGIGSVQTQVAVATTDIGSIQVDNSGTVEGGYSVANGITLAFSTTVSQGIAGAITVEGNSTNLNNPFTLYVNAFSPTNYSYANTQVSITPSASSATASYQMQGLEDGLYQIYTYLDGYEIFPQGPKTVNVVNGRGDLSFTLKKFSGVAIVRFTTSAAGGYNDVSLRVDGNGISFSTGDIQRPPSQAQFRQFATTGEIVLSNLGTGFYDFTSSFKGRYLTKKANILNGQTAVIDLDFSGNVYTVTGTAKVQAFTYGVTSSFPSGIRINTISDLVDRSKVGLDTVYVGTGNTQVPIARIEAYPRTSSNFGSGISNLVSVNNAANVGTAGGFAGTQFNTGQVRFGTIDSSGNWRIDNLFPGVYILRHPLNLDPSATYYTSTVGGSFETNTADVGNEQKVISISTAGLISVIEPLNGNLEFTYQAGAQLSGQILLPASNPSDTRFMTLVVLNSRKEIVSWQSIYLNGASANYSVTNLGDGDYTVILNDERKGNETNPDNYVFAAGNTSNYEKYVAKPLNISIRGSNLSGQNIQLYRAGFAEGKLAIVRISSTGVKTTELITSNNANLLPSSFRVYAYHDTIDKSNISADSNGSGFVSIDSAKGTFRISKLFPDTEFRILAGPSGSSFGSADVLGQGKLNVVPVEKTGYTVGAGQILDVGTLEMPMGLTISGQVQGPDQSGSTVPVANVRVSVRASGATNHEEIIAFTDSRGSYTVSGLNPDQRFYDFIFASRNDRQDTDVNFSALINISGFAVQKDYAQKTKKNVDVRIATQTVNVVLERGLGAFTGRVTTADGGPLKNPVGGNSDMGYPVATIIMNKLGDIPTNNPIGDIEVRTDLQGNFTIDRLAPGTYELYAMSLGYAVKKMLIHLASSDTAKAIGDVQLQNGLELSGEIVKPDGTHPLADREVSILAAANSDFSELTIASLISNPQTGTIDGYSLAGLKAGTTYTLMIFNESGQPITPPERLPSGNSGIRISTTTKNFNLTFAQSAPQVVMKGKKTGTKIGGIDQYKFEFVSTHPLRNKTNREKEDTYWQDVVSISAGTGGTSANLSADPADVNPINPERKKVTVLYVPPSAATSKVSLRFNSPTTELMPGTTTNFVIDKVFDYYLGLSGQKLSSINLMKGDNVSIEGDDTEFLIPGGAFKKADGTDLDVSSSVSVGLQKATDVSQATGAVNAAPALAAAQPLDESMPPILANAMKSMRVLKSLEVEKTSVKGAPGILGAASVASDVATNVLSSFYDLFLPAGVRRTLAKNATVTLSYTSAPANTSALNVYFYNDTNSSMFATDGTTVAPGAYGLESTGRSLNTSNNTISVSVNHFTVYVVVNSTESVLGSASVLGSVTSTNLTLPTTVDYSGGELEVFNFPNPFDATARGFNFTGTKTSGQQTLHADGSTAIRYALPSNLGPSDVRATCEIYDVAGDLVKRLDFGYQTTGKYHYADWDGKNEDGETVASGVYIGRLSIEGSSRTKTFKMAVIK